MYNFYTILQKELYMENIREHKYIVISNRYNIIVRFKKEQKLQMNFNTSSLLTGYNVSSVLNGDM